MKLSIRTQLVILLVLVGVLPAALIAAVYSYERHSLEKAFANQYAQAAADMMEKIDRNLFERYGDVQAFGYNAAAHDPANFRRPDRSNPLVAAMDNYVRAYGLYPVMMLLSPQGDVLAINTRDLSGKELPTAPVYNRNFRAETWFKDALEGRYLNGRNGLTGTVVGQPVRSELVASIVGGDGFVIPFSAQVRNDAGELVGVWVNFADFGLVEKIIADYYTYMLSTGIAEPDVMLVDPTGTKLVDFELDMRQADGSFTRDFDNLLKSNLAADGLQAASKVSAGEDGYTRETNPDTGDVSLVAYAHSKGAYDFTGLGWGMLISAAESDVYAVVVEVTHIMMLAMGAILLAAIILGLLVGTMASTPLRRLADIVGRMARKDLNLTVPYASRGDEIGLIARSLDIFRTEMQEGENLRTEQERAKIQAEVDKRNLMNKLADDFEMAVKGVVTSVGNSAEEMGRFARDLTSSSEQTSSRAGNVAAASEQAAANVSTVATATEELTASIQEITRQVSDSSRTASAAVDEARQTNHVVSSMAMAAQKIGDVVQLISEIANQTNLLALNATIEAARAGEAGKGFAVVASEVKNLASQTAKATEEITTQISSMQNVATDAVKAINGISGTIERINSITSSIAAAVEEQSAATGEISRNVQEAAQGTKEVSSNIGAVTQAAGETGQVAESVLLASGLLQDEATRLSREVDAFINKVRSA